MYLAVWAFCDGWTTFLDDRKVVDCSGTCTYITRRFDQDVSSQASARPPSAAANPLRRHRQHRRTHSPLMSPTAFSSASIDLEAQVAFPAPTRVMPDSSRTAPVAPVNPTDELFGYTFSSSPRTRDSRHDSVRMSISDVPPPYVEESDVPAYTLHAPEPMTLAMYLFKFGFCTFSPLPLHKMTKTHLYFYKL